MFLSFEKVLVKFFQEIKFGKLFKSWLHLDANSFNSESVNGLFQALMSVMLPEKTANWQLATFRYDPSDKELFWRFSLSTTWKALRGFKRMVKLSCHIVFYKLRCAFEELTLMLIKRLSLWKYNVIRKKYAHVATRLLINTVWWELWC